MIFRLTLISILFCSSLFVSGQAAQKKTYPLVIRFISQGSGVPDKKPIMEFIQSFQKKYKTKKIKVDTIGSKGKEGEYSLALALTELTKSQKTSFIQKIKNTGKKPGDRGEIQYEENVTVNKPKNPIRVRSQKVNLE